jgi:biotin carboxylase
VCVQAEDPDEGFKPTTGALKELTFNAVPNVWGYFSIKVRFFDFRPRSGDSECQRG